MVRCKTKGKQKDFKGTTSLLRNERFTLKIETISTEDDMYSVVRINGCHHKPYNNDSMWRRV